MTSQSSRNSSGTGAAAAGSPPQQSSNRIDTTVTALPPGHTKLFGPCCRHCDKVRSHLSDAEDQLKILAGRLASAEGGLESVEEEKKYLHVSVQDLHVRADATAAQLVEITKELSALRSGSASPRTNLPPPPGPRRPRPDSETREPLKRQTIHIRGYDGEDHDGNVSLSRLRHVVF